MDPDQHTFINFITKYIGKGWGYFSGWSYWVSFGILGMAEITRCFQLCPALVSKLASLADSNYLLALLSCVKLDRCEGFGEVEFWFGMIKIVTILALIATGIFMVTTNFETPAGHASLTNITSGFKCFQMVGSSLSWPSKWSSLLIKRSSLSELLLLKQLIPPSIAKAIKEIPIRIVIFYVGALLAIMAIFPWQQLPVNKSPFVTVFQMVGISGQQD